MKILMLIDSLTSGGKERRFVELVKGLNGNKSISCEIVLLSDIVHYGDIFRTRFPIHYLVRKSKRDFSVFFKLLHICKRFKPEIIQSWEPMCSIYSFPIAKILNIKFVNAMIANAPDKLVIFSKFWIAAKISFPFSDIVLANSKAGLKTYRVSEKKKHFIHNGFDLNRIDNIVDKDVIRRKFNINTKYLIGMVGAFGYRKDYTTFLKAATTILEKNSDISFMAIGAGPNLDEYKQMVQDDYKEKILFTGLQDNIESIINIFDIGVLITNREKHGEGISNAILEYMALAKPVIATEGGGTNELVVDNETGYLIKNGDDRSLAKTIVFLIDHPDVINRMGRKGEERLRTHFNLNMMTYKYIKLYSSILKRDIPIALPLKPPSTPADNAL